MEEDGGGWRGFSHLVSNPRARRSERAREKADASLLSGFVTEKVAVGIPETFVQTMLECAFFCTGPVTLASIQHFCLLRSYTNASLVNQGRRRSRGSAAGRNRFTRATLGVGYTSTASKAFVVVRFPSHRVAHGS